MFEAISKLFSQPEPQSDIIDTKLAVAALLVHLIGVDGEVEKSEEDTVRGVLEDHYDLSEDEVEELLVKAHKQDANAVDLYKFTSGITQLDMEQRIEIIRMMWTVVYADKENHELEDNMVWRVAELIGVSARDRTTLRAQMKRT